MAELDALLALAEEASGCDGAAEPAAPAAGSGAGPQAAAGGVCDDDLLLVLAAEAAEPAAAKPKPTDSSAARTPPRPAQQRPGPAMVRSISSAAGGTSLLGAGAQQQQQQQQQTMATKKRAFECQHFVEKLSGIKIKLPRVSGVVLRERYRQMTYVPVAAAKEHQAAAGAAWVVVGVLVAKSFGTTSSGQAYSRWRVSDLRGTDAWVALFGDAHKDHYAEVEGSVLAFYSPRLPTKGPGGGSSSSSSGLAVAQASQVELLATCAGWGFCKGKTKTGGRCNNAVDTSVSSFCQYHALQQAKAVKAATRQAAAGRAAPAVAAAAADAARRAPVPSSGKVYDARSSTWSRQQPAAVHISSVAAAAAAGGGSASGGGLLSTGSGGGLLPKQFNSLSGAAGRAAAAPAPTFASAAAVDAGAAGAAERQRHAQQQADIKAALRSKLQQQQQQQQQLHLGSRGKPASTPGSIGMPAAAAPAAPVRFHLASVVSAVESDATGSSPQQLQQQQQKGSLQAGQAGADHGMEVGGDDELVIQAPAAAAPAHAGSQRPPPGSSRGSGSAAAVGSSRAAASRQDKLRADLGLGGAKAATAGRKNSSSSSSSSSLVAAGRPAAKAPRVSRIGAPEAAAAAAGASRGGQGNGASSSGSSSFRASFQRVLQRQDVNKPDAKLLAAASDGAHAAAFAKMLDQFEAKDQLAQQLEAITQLTVTAFACRTCNVLTEKRHASCAGHDVAALRVTKRWFTCEACNWRVSTLHELLPTKRCPKCRDPGKHFRRASAYAAPKVMPLSAHAAANGLASREGMLARGLELPKFGVDH